MAEVSTRAAARSASSDGPPGPPEAFYPRPFELSGLRSGAVNVRDLGEDVQVVVVRDGEVLRIFREICPHMGGPLGEAIVCPDGTLECPWHGYRFRLATGQLADNPNERIMAELRRRAPDCFRPDQAPRYALAPLAYQVAGDLVYVERKRSRP
jgi:nitrite reductase/ring-hydroxylating ferredoxin subunit